ncbi:MAG: hypothetical protein JXA25_12820 [Anaerolineales bacterium]|nr:hypothetical protein [Anaerolineales bacterium]
MFQSKKPYSVQTGTQECCLDAVVEIPGGMGEVEVTIDYTCGALYRLTAADYEKRIYFQSTALAASARSSRRVGSTF